MFFKLAVATAEINITVGLLKGVTELPFPEQVVDENPERRVVTRYVPLGWFRFLCFHDHRAVEITM